MGTIDFNSFDMKRAKTQEDMGKRAELNHNASEAARMYQKAIDLYKQVILKQPALKGEISDLISGLEEKIGVLESGSFNLQAVKAQPKAPQTPATPSVATQSKPKEQTSTKTDAAQEKRIDENELREALQALNDLIGLKQVKTQINDWVKQVKVYKLKEARGLPIPPVTYHMVFTGNPGTGKTTVARLISKIYHSLGITRIDNTVECDRAGLVAGYVGQTGAKTLEVCEKARGGILFIDEAYTLKKDGNDFGQDAIDTLLKYMEDNRDDIVVIVAGYEDKMQDFINSNAGLSSRFKNFIGFEDYDGESMYRIFETLAKKNRLLYNGQVKAMLQNYFDQRYQNRDANFGNARDVRNTFENLITAQASRLFKIDNPTDDDLCTILPEDVLLATASKKKLNPLEESYLIAKSEASYSYILSLLGQGKTDEAVIKLAIFTEALLKYLGYTGDLFSMIDALIAKKGDKRFTLLHKIRMERNNAVHSSTKEGTLTPEDILSAARLLEELSK